MQGKWSDNGGRVDNMGTMEGTMKGTMVETNGEQWVKQSEEINEGLMGESNVGTMGGS